MIDLAIVSVIVATCVIVGMASAFILMGGSRRTWIVGICVGLALAGAVFVAGRYMNPLGARV